MTTSFLVVKNRAHSKLAAAITDSALSLTVTTGEGSNFPSTFPFHITIDDEILVCTNRSTDTLTVTRAAQSTTAAIHSNKSYVALNITAQSVTDLNTAVNTLEGYCPSAAVLKATYTAYTILMATTTATPIALTVGEQTLVGRKTSGAIAALSGADALLAMGITPLVAELNYVDGVTSAIQGQIDAKAPIASPTFTGTVTLPTGSLTAAPLKFVSGVVLTTPVAGTMEFVTDTLSFTITSGAARKTIAFLESPAFTTPNIGVASATSLATSAAIPLLLTYGQLVNISLTSQTVGATTLTIPDFASVVDEFTFKTKAQTMANKTLTSPTINGTIGTTGLTMPTFTAAGVITITGSDANSHLIRDDTDTFIAIRGSSDTAGAGAYFVFFGKDYVANPGKMIIHTPNAAGNADTQRLVVSGVVDIAVLTLSAVTVTGLVLSGSVAGGSQTMTGMGSINGLVITANTGAITTGSWTATVISPVYGGTGVANNVASTITITGAFATTLTVTAATGVTLPTSGILVSSVTTGNGVSATNTAGALAFTLGVITPTSVNGLTLVAAATGFTIAGGTTSKTLTVPLDASVSGTNTGDNTVATSGDSATSFFGAGVLEVAIGGTGVTASTGTVAVVLSTSPTLVTPILGVASATSLATSAAIPLLLTYGQLVNISLTSQTVGATTLTIPNFASVSDTFVFTTLAQELTAKTLNASVLKGTFTASGTVIFPAFQMAGALNAGGNEITGVSSLSRGDSSLSIKGRDGVLFDNAARTNTGTANVARTSINSTNAITCNTGTVPVAASLIINEPNLTIGTGAVTIGATLYIVSAPTEGATNYALYIASGANYLVGDLVMGASAKHYPISGVAGFSVVSTALTLGSLGSVVIPQSGANCTDALCGNVAGAIGIDLTTNTERFYFRGAAGWFYISKSGGLSMTKEERVSPEGHEFQIDDKIELVVDKINPDGSFHALPHYAGVN